MTPLGIAATVAALVNTLIAIAAILIAIKALRAARSSATETETRQDPAHVQQLRASLLGAARRSSRALPGRIVMGRPAVRRRAAGGVHVC